MATVLVLGGCADVLVTDVPLIGRPPLCQAARGDLGDLVVLPETQWRPDQKEPALREAIAKAAIEAALPAVPCATSCQVHPFKAWSREPEPALCAVNAAAGFETIAFLQVRELGPLLYISFPVLWSTMSETRFRLRVVRAADGIPLFDVERQRLVGGPFALRGVAVLQGEMERALRDLVAGP